MHQRPPRLYRDIPPKAYEKMQKIALQYVNKFPWNTALSREQAIAQGWEPPPDAFWTVLEPSEWEPKGDDGESDSSREDKEPEGQEKSEDKKPESRLSNQRKDYLGL